MRFTVAAGFDGVSPSPLDRPLRSTPPPHKHHIFFLPSSFLSSLTTRRRRRIPSPPAAAVRYLRLPLPALAPGCSMCRLPSSCPFTHPPDPPLRPNSTWLYHTPYLEHRLSGTKSVQIVLWIILWYKRLGSLCPNIFTYKRFAHTFVRSVHPRLLSSE